MLWLHGESLGIFLDEKTAQGWTLTARRGRGAALLAGRLYFRGQSVLITTAVLWFTDSWTKPFFMCVCVCCVRLAASPHCITQPFDTFRDMLFLPSLELQEVWGNNGFGWKFGARLHFCLMMHVWYQHSCLPDRCQHWLSSFSWLINCGTASWLCLLLNVSALLRLAFVWQCLFLILHGSLMLFEVNRTCLHPLHHQFVFCFFLSGSTLHIFVSEIHSPLLAARTVKCDRDVRAVHVWPLLFLIHAVWNDWPATFHIVAEAQMQSKAMQALIHGCHVALTCHPTLPGLQLTDVFTLGNSLCRHDSLQSCKWYTVTPKSSGPTWNPRQLPSKHTHLFNLFKFISLILK